MVIGEDVETTDVDSLYKNLLNEWTTTEGLVHGHGKKDTGVTMLGGVPLPLIVTVAIVASVIVGNIIICGVIYCVRRKRRKQQMLISERRSMNGSAKTNRKVVGKVSGSVSNGSIKGNNRKSLPPVNDEQWRLTKMEEGSNGVRGGSVPRRFDIPKPTLDSLQSFDSSRGKVASDLSSRPVPMSPPPTVVLSGMAKRSHIVLQKSNSSGRLSVSLEDFCEVEETGEQTKSPFRSNRRQITQDSIDEPTPRRHRNYAHQYRADQNDPANRSLLVRRNSLPKQLVLQELEDDHHRNYQHQTSTLPRQPHPQPPPEREINTAIRLVNHTRMVTPPSSNPNSATSSAASPPSVMSVSPGSRPPKLLPGYRTASSMDNYTPSPVTFTTNQQDRALPAPPPPPKPRQLMARYHQCNQNSVKMVKFCEEATEIPTDDAGMRALPPSPPLEEPSENSQMTNWSRMASENSTPTSTKRVTVIGSSRVTGL